MKYEYETFLNVIERFFVSFFSYIYFNVIERLKKIKKAFLNVLIHFQTFKKCLKRKKWENCSKIFFYEYVCNGKHLIKVTLSGAG